MTSMLMVEWLHFVKNKCICFIYMVIPTGGGMLCCYYQDINLNASLLARLTASVQVHCHHQPAKGMLLRCD